MPTPKLSDEDCTAAVRALADAGGNKTNAAAALNIPRGTFANRIRAAAMRGIVPDESATPLSFPNFPSEEMPTDALIDHMSERFRRRHENQRAKKWFPIKVNLDGPIGVCWFGDPHVDDNGCNWPLLKRDVEIVAATEGMFGANIGDTENNWSGRLARLWADQDTSKDTARQLVRWLLLESKIDWVLWLFGNHDAWGDESALVREMGAHAVHMHDWQAQFKLVFPNGREAKVWAAHNFPGHSMYHGLQGALKAARMKAEAHLYICGHLHQWSLFHDESADREFVFWLARARGYKFLDHYAEVLGHRPQQEGASIVSIFDPDATSQTGFLHCYADVEEAAEYLTWKRSRARS